MWFSFLDFSVCIPGLIVYQLYTFNHWFTQYLVSSRHMMLTEGLFRIPPPSLIYHVPSLSYLRIPLSPPHTAVHLVSTLIYHPTFFFMVERIRHAYTHISYGVLSFAKELDVIFLVGSLCRYDTWFFFRNQNALILLEKMENLVQIWLIPYLIYARPHIKYFIIDSWRNH